MPGLISNSLQSAACFVLRERVALQKTRVDHLTQAISEANSKKQTIAAQLATAQTKAANLKAHYQQSLERCQNKQDELNKLRNNDTVLIRERDEALQASQEAKTRHEMKKFQLDNLAKSIQTITEKVNQINREILKQDTILASPAPQPQYQTTGGTCIHGHVNCPNLPIVNPGQTTLTNQAEITAHTNRIESARKEKIRLLAQKGHLLQDDNELRKQYAQLEYEAMTANGMYMQSENLVREKKQLLAANQLLQAQAEKAHHDLLVEKNIFGDQLASSENEVNQFTQALATAEYELTSKQNQQRMMELELQRLTDQLEDAESAARKAEAEARLEEMARKELALEMLAKQELEQENQRAANHQAAQGQPSGSTMHSFFNGAANRIDDAKHAVAQAKHLVSDVVHTAGNLWPAPVGTTVTAMFDGANGIQKNFFGNELKHTHDLVVDAANQEQIRLTK